MDLVNCLRERVAIRQLRINEQQIRLFVIHIMKKE